ncbi:MAG TPA: mevalonate kinase [Labilithrix sp.]|nr:mevalonate kinase [Labilithrix sp.]
MRSKATEKAVEGTARGKVILFGEHAVVYGVPAIAVGIDRGVRAWSTPSVDNVSSLRVGTWNLTVREDGKLPIARAFRDLLLVTRQSGAAVDAVTVNADVELPPGGGLGSSAALGVAVARALDPGAPGSAIAERANVWECVFHGNPSGIDTAVSALGGCVLFERSARVEANDDEREYGGHPFGPVAGSGVRSRTLAPNISRIRVPGAMHLCVGHSGKASSTRSMVEAVARLRERQPAATQRAFDAIRVIVKDARVAIEAADRPALGQLLDQNQTLLSELLVSTPEVETMCRSARVAGALGAKLTGAGGGGSVVALVDNQDIGARVLSAWKREGFEGFLTTFGASVQGACGPALLEGAA